MNLIKKLYKWLHVTIAIPFILTAFALTLAFRLIIAILSILYLCIGVFHIDVSKNVLGIIKAISENKAEIEYKWKPLEKIED